MGNNVDNQSALSKILARGEEFDAWLKGLYGATRAEQQSALKGVFTVVEDNNVTASQKKALEAKALTLQEQVEKLEAKMAVLAEEMAKNEKKIQKAVDEIAELVQAAAEKSEKLQNMQADWAKKCVRDVFNLYENGGIGKDAIAAEIYSRIMHGDPGAQSLKMDIEDVLGDLDDQDRKVSGLVNDASRWIDQKKLLESRYGCTKSAYDMLQANIAQIGSTGTNYTNMDTDTKIPIYSPEKVATVTDLMSNPAYNIPGGNSKKTEGAETPTPMSLEQVREKHKDNLGVAATGSDRNSASNDAVKALGKALDDGLFEDLVSTGMSFDDIKNFFADNFKNANIKVNDNGKMSIPYGHGSDAHKIFGALEKKVENYNPYQGALNTWDDCGNTIESNPQIGALEQFVNDDNFAKLKEQGFTFKEAMYALFDPEKGLFKDTGIVYDVDEQTGEPTYFMQYAGDEATANLFKDVATQIFDNWGVGFYRGASAFEREPSDTPTEVPTEPTPSEVEKTDPMSFYIGEDKNNKYSFVIDRNDDGKFSGKEDFAGGEGDWRKDLLDEYDADGNGILEGDELKDVKLLGTKFDDNAKEYKEGDHVRGERTDIEYQFTSAADLGITSIDLRDESQGTTWNAGEKTGEDINGNDVFSDSFTMQMNGKDVEVHRLDETDDYMKAIYGGETGAFGKSYTVGLSEAEADEIIAKDYAEFDDFDSRFAKLFDNIAILQNVGDIAQDARSKYEEVLELIREQNEVEFTKADNRSRALTEHPNWSRMETAVLAEATTRGMTVSDADMIQMKGIYMKNGSLSVKGVVDEYQNQLKKEEQVNAAKSATKATWAIMVECIKNGIVPDSKEIMTELLSEH